MRSLALLLVLAAPIFAQDEYPYDFEKNKVNLPETSSAELERIFRSKNTIFYKLPQAWQHYVPSSRIEQKNLTLNTVSYFNTAPIYSIYAGSFNQDFHANNNFPWETTFGLNPVHKVFKDSGKEYPYFTINFINLPELDTDGSPIPILIINGYPIKWIFPPGTTVGEILFVKHKGENYAQEVRTRRKGGDSIYWEPGLYRPIATRAEFEEITGIHDYVAAKKHFHFRNPQEDEVFLIEGLVERLPYIPEDKVKEILSMPFREIDLNNVWTAASDQDFDIFPKDYCFSLLNGVDVVSCANCHRQTQISVRNLTPKDPDVIKFPTKIGNIRGSDAVFTWHPFDKRCIRLSDKDPVTKPVLRIYDLQNGFVKVAQGDEESTYKLTEFVQFSLKTYELPSEKYLHKKEVNASLKKPKE